MRGERGDHWRSLHGMDAQQANDPIDARIAALAELQYGVVARRQLASAGVGRGAIERRLTRGSLVPLHRGVYAVGHRRLTQDGFWLAAVLAAGPRAALSHRDAASFHGLGRWRTRRIEVTTAGRAAVASGVRVYQRRLLSPDDVTVVEGIPVTTIERTLVDLAAVVSHDRLAHALSEAERRRVIDARALRAAIARVEHRPGPGYALLRAVLAEHRRRGVTLTRHELEIAFRALVRDHRLPEPELNAWIDGDEIDAVWRAERVAVECDGWEAHRGRRAFQRDRTKSNDLLLRGWRLLRFTHADVVHDPADVAARIRTALSTPA